MENTYNVYAQQSWIDLAIILYGDASLAQSLAWYNNSSLWTNPSLKQSIKVPPMPSQQLNLLSFKERRSIPATAPTEQQKEMITKTNIGISYWEINEDFEVQFS